MYSFDEYEQTDRVTLNGGGVRFETYITTLQNIADTRLAWITENVDEETLHKKEFFFDRHPGAFIHILNFYRTGKLHTPTDICGPAFEEELQFWGIDEKQMEPCCWESFTKHREAEGNLRTFEGPGFEDLNQSNNRKYSTYMNIDNQKGYRKHMNALWDVFEDPHSSKIAKRFSLISCGMIIISLSVYCLTTMPNLRNNAILSWINRICLIFFTIEFVARVVVCPCKSDYLKNYRNWVDVLSIIPSFLLIGFPQTKWIQNLVIIRLLRVFKFFKLSYGLQVLLHTLKASSHELTLLLLILLIPLVIFSSLVYAFETTLRGTNTKFDSIPRTFWWCIITMTTVGYGDIIPETWPGQIIGSICAIIGVLIIALPISVIGNNFTLYYAHVRARLKLPKKNRHLLQGRLRGLLRQPAMLSSRDRNRKIIKRNGHSLLSSGSDRLMLASPSHLQQMKRRQPCLSEHTSSELELSISNETVSPNEETKANYLFSVNNEKNCQQMTNEFLKVSNDDLKNEKINSKMIESVGYTKERMFVEISEQQQVNNQDKFEMYEDVKEDIKHLLNLPSPEEISNTKEITTSTTCVNSIKNFLHKNNPSTCSSGGLSENCITSVDNSEIRDISEQESESRRKSMQLMTAYLQQQNAPNPPGRTRSKTITDNIVGGSLTDTICPQYSRNRSTANSFSHAHIVEYSSCEEFMNEQHLPHTQRLGKIRLIKRNVDLYGNIISNKDKNELVRESGV